MNVEILDQLVQHRSELTAPDCAEHLARSVFGVFVTDGADALHRAALVRATVSLCPV
ncbi:hypothetical protein [Nocardia sp. R7R-8]|uniref:hypothetical protein n=1 Tax=Nocardia sp. R7R-8 TaxID=3459304 RepID=UPI00403DF178